MADSRPRRDSSQIEETAAYLWTNRVVSDGGDLARHQVLQRRQGDHAAWCGGARDRVGGGGGAVVVSLQVRRRFGYSSVVVRILSECYAEAKGSSG